MNAVVLAAIGLVAIFSGYRFYSKFMAEKIYQLDPDFETPSHAMRDDIDYVPTNRFVLWGHHFTAVAGAAPIIGPSIAVVWGWLPAFLWVVLGTMFFAGVHDFGAIWASVRNKALSVGSLTGEVVSHRARNLFMIVVFFLLLMVNAVFAVAIAGEFINTPASVIPAWTAVVVAVAIGILLYKVGVGITWPTVLGTIILYAVIYLGELFPIALAPMGGIAPAAQWILILFAYAAVASMLPVWLLLQPRDYINGIQLFVGLGILYGAVLLAAPSVVAPAINPNVPPATPPLMPLLFVTIACGAISGFHGLVSSGTTSKQLNKETDARFVGYLGSLGEGALAIVAIIAVTAGFSMAEWQSSYANAESFGAVGGISAFVEGGSRIAANGLGMPLGFAQTLLAVMAVLFAGTTMDAGVRLQRYIVQEWGAIYSIPPLQNGYVATAIAVGACLVLAFGAGGADGSGGMIIWPLFGTTNQLLAGLTLLVISVMLVQRRRPARYTLIPMVFVTTMALLSALYQLSSLYTEGNYLLVAIDVIIIITAIFVMLEAASALMRERRAAAGMAAS
ncbi:MAG: carbon starvation protein A [Acidobacteria bacterium]|nr:carbon starvation protein A [Acidobacteriota bacterium]MXZ72842.1 carbon starvation protein A [Acidobacteriota bacterium]MYD69955.1 carbon starvation protein A [Acidobacteriota bacterium]MYJ05348.1 carbon starvation protein A [Acidobacteriota bacterium]